MGGEACNIIISFLYSNHLNKYLNFIYIAIIPKVKNSTWVNDFQPISVCNALYKIILKVLANRLKVVLLHIISYNQSAFIFGRLITYNILTTYE
jgi:hypothetical protein